MNKIISIVVSLVLIVGSYVMLVANTPKVLTVASIEVRDGVQYITIQVKGGYTPRNIVASSSVPTKLIMKTNETRDCSSSLVIKSIGYQKNLPATGETVIDIGTKMKGEMVEGICSMGMYGFKVEFE